MRNNKGQFEKGLIPWNKGTKGLIVVSKETRKKQSEIKKGKKNPYQMTDEIRMKMSLSHIGKKRSIESNIKQGNSIRGEKHYKWKKDRTQIKQYWTERNNPEYKQWRMKVWQRDEFKCKMENDGCNGSIIAHHILPWREYVELRYEVNNGITLCQFHHPRKRAEEAKLSPYFQSIVAEGN